MNSNNVLQTKSDGHKRHYSKGKKRLQSLMFDCKARYRSLQIGGCQ